MEHVGIDVHQKYSEICWLSEEGEVKQRRRLATTSLDAPQRLEDGEVSYQPVSTDADPARQFEARERLGRLERAIDRLPGEYRKLVLLRHSAVSEVAAFSIHSTAHGDTPFAAVVVRSQASADELELHCRSWLGVRSPRNVVIVSGLPRNAAGKILKHKLPELLRDRPRPQNNS